MVYLMGWARVGTLPTWGNCRNEPLPVPRDCLVWSTWAGMEDNLEWGARAKDGSCTHGEG